jgi:DNA-3-methyladenine glycosylase I
MSYCSAIPQMTPESRKALHQHYHDHLYGFPLKDDHELFGRLLLEINQAGLSWETILKKESSFREAYAQFNIDQVAAFDEQDRARLMSDAGIIRNRLKIEAVIYNAQQIQLIQKSHGSFAEWLAQHHPLEKKEWIKLFKKTFKFTGGEIVGEFLMSIGYLKGAHDKTCPVYSQILTLKPAWSIPK